jgi:hypothetical protein
MNRKTIVILIVLTAIFAVVALTLLKKETTIENVIISNNADLIENEAKNTEDTQIEFTRESEIFAIILVKNITKKDTISIKWEIIENITEKIVQDDKVIPKEEGSGELIVSLARKNNQHEIGKYKLSVSLNNQTPIIKEFTVK